MRDGTVSPIALALLGLGGFFLLSQSSKAASARGDNGDPDLPGPQPSMSWDPNMNADNLQAWAVEGLSPSPQLVDFLKRREGFLATKTWLGDGGATIGYGHYEPTGPKADALPDTITQEQALQLLTQDIQARAVVNVNKYINVPLTQQQYDAMVSLAYNLSPGSFSHIAEAVNNGQGLDPIIFNYVQAGTQFEVGLTARREDELNLYNNGVYA
jgi:lysozyme